MAVCVVASFSGASVVEDRRAVNQPSSVHASDAHTPSHSCNNKLFRALDGGGVKIGFGFGSWGYFVYENENC